MMMMNNNLHTITYIKHSNISIILRISNSLLLHIYINNLNPLPLNLPSSLTPEGLSLTRQWYLHDKICEFVPYDKQDSVCAIPRKRPSISSDEEDK